MERSIRLCSHSSAANIQKKADIFYYKNWVGLTVVYILALKIYLKLHKNLVQIILQLDIS